MALALACLAAGTAACSGSAHPGRHPAGAAAGRGASASSAAAAGRVPAASAASGALNARLAATAYRAVIVPVYPTAVRLADTLANGKHGAADKHGAAAQASAFTSGLSKTLASLNGVTAFPGAANGSFTAYRAQARALLATLARPAAVTSSVSARRQAALALYALAREIGQLGTDLSLVPATEAGGQH